MKNNKYINKAKSIGKKYWHLIVLLLVSAFSVYVSLQGYEKLKTASEWTFIGNDSWYHFRATMYQVINYPSFLGFDPMTGYPGSGQASTFGTMYDLFHATVAMIIGLGDPSQELVRQILIVSPPFMSGIAVISVYIMTRHISGSKYTGLLAAGILSLIPGTFYIRSRAGFANHHMVEVILLISSIYMISKTIRYAQREYILYEIIKSDYKSDKVKKWFGFVLLTTFAMLMYYATWPPSVMIMGLLGGSAILYGLIGYSRDVIVEPGLLTMLTISIGNLLVILVNRPELSELSIAQPSLVHVGVGLISIILAGIAYGLNKIGNQNNWSKKKFYGVASGLLLIPTILILVIEPSLIERIYQIVLRLLSYPFGLGEGDGVQTISEERSSSIYELAIGQYGLLIVLTMASFVLYLKRIYEGLATKNGFAEDVFVLVVSVFIFVISVRTVRFNYYMAAVIAMLSAYMIQKIFFYAGLNKEIIQDISKFRSYHVIAIFIVLTLVVPVIVVPIETPAVYDQSVNVDSGYEDWQGTMQWLDENGKENGIEKYGDYGPGDEYKYSNESYGVMSWWDYGHWITVTGDKSPVANPFQTNTDPAAKFLLTNDPDEAQEVIDNLNKTSDTAEVDDTKVKYVAIDWQTVEPFSKMTAITQFNDNVTNDELFNTYYQTTRGGSAAVSFASKTQRYHESMMSRLYYGHGSYIGPSKYTIKYDTQQTRSGNQIRQITPELNYITKHNTTEEAVSYSNNNSQVAYGGIGRYPKEPVRALEHYRLVKTSDESTFRKRTIARQTRNIDNNIEGNLTLTDIDTNPAAVKLFEKVDGAKVQISGDKVSSESKIRVEVPIGDRTTKNRFTYTQYSTVENGTSEFVLPYSNTGYDILDYEPSVFGLESYKIYNSDNEQIGSFNVTESNVLNGESISVKP